MSYKEIKKIRRESGNLASESIIAEDFRVKMFHHTKESLHSTNYPCLKIEKNYGAGVSVSIYKNGKRRQELSVELGKSDIDLLKSFLESIELKDYTGTFVPTTLIDLSKK